MKKIVLSYGRKNREKRVALVDDEDYKWLNKYKWSAFIRKKSWATHAVRTKYLGQKDGKVRCTTVQMHREIMERHDLNPNNMDIDHADRNGLNNQKHNLRPCTKKQNNSNIAGHADAISKYKGVSRCGYTKRLKNGIKKRYISRRKWQVSISANGKRKFIGVFNTEESAALAYNEAAIKYHGEFAYLNIIQ